MKKLIPLVTVLIILTPSIALAAGEAAEVGRMFQECINSGGRAASTYNAWVAQNGCICPGSSTGSGQRTCRGASGSSGNTGSSGNLVTDSTKNVVQGIMNNNAQQMGIGFMGIAGAALIQGMQSDPAADARRAQEAAIAAEQQRRAEEERRAEALRQQELAKQRILGQLKGTEPSVGLALKTGDSDSSMTVTETRGAFGSTVVTPTGIDSSPAEHGLQLKLGDDADRGSMQARQGFDTAGKMVGSNLPPPPPTPTSITTDKKVQMLNALRSTLKRNEAEEQSLKDQLTQLQRAPTLDPVAINQVQEKIVAKETEKKKIMLDLTADDPDAPGVAPSSSNATSDATSVGATATGASH